MSSLPGTGPTRFLNSATTVAGHLDPTAEAPSRNDPPFPQSTSLQELFKHLMSKGLEIYTWQNSQARPEATMKASDVENGTL
jgi:hypothetical protein